MNSKHLILLMTVLGLCMTGLGDLTPETFVLQTFGSVPGEQTVSLLGDTGKTAASILGSRYPGAAVSYWREGGTTVWSLRARGKESLVAAAFVVSEGRIVGSEVLECRETRGQQIRSERFLRQFSGVSLKKNRQLSRRIDGYSGATRTVNAMRGMARLALWLDGMAEPAESVEK